MSSLPRFSGSGKPRLQTLEEYTLEIQDNMIIVNTDNTTLYSSYLKYNNTIVCYNETSRHRIQLCK